MSVHVISSGPSAPASFQDTLDTHQFVFAHIVRQIFYEPNPSIDIASVYRAVSTLALEDQYQIVHFVRVEMKDVLETLKKPIDEQVANHFLVYRDGTELGRTTLEKDIRLILSRILGGGRVRTWVESMKIILSFLSDHKSDSKVGVGSALSPTASSNW